MTMRPSLFLQLALVVGLLASSACSSIDSSKNDTFVSPTLMEEERNPALLESRLLTMTSPTIIRRGELAIIELTFASVTDSSLGLLPPLPKANKISNILAEAKLELTGTNVRPPGLLSQPLYPSRDISFEWYFHPQEIGIESGTVWLFLRFIPQEEYTNSVKIASAPGTQLIVAALPVEFTVISLGVISGSLARVLGIAGLLLAIVLALPLLLKGFSWSGSRQMK
jgi:hypothetical protein